MYVTLTIARYPRLMGWAGFLSMALFRLPALLNKKLSFYKLLGSGKNGTFDKTPDLRQWGIIATFRQELSPLSKAVNSHSIYSNNAYLYGSFIAGWWRFFNCETCTFVLEPIEGHGLWDGKKVFGELPKNSDHQQMVAVLTRATIRLNKLNSFWKNVDGAAKAMALAPGFITSLGVGEVPWIKQATFSIWQSKTAMKDFAYRLKVHAEVIQKTRKENWYKEEMFTRFKVLSVEGTINGTHPLGEKV